MRNFLLTVILLAGVLGEIGARPSSEERRLIKTSEAEPARWLTEEQVLDLVLNRVHFMDITDNTFPTVGQDAVPAPNAFPTSLKYEAIVKSAFPRLSASRAEAFVTRFSAFKNRYYNGPTGVEASNWLVSQVEESIQNSGYTGNATVTTFGHTWAQNSVIARLQGSQPGVIIMGGHLDSINVANGPSGTAPGADDNASGSAALLEAFRALLETGFVPAVSIEFHWYAAEEIGLRGALDIAQRYYNTGVDVVSMMNFDVVGYYTGIRKVSFLTDYTNVELNNFLRLVVDSYLEYDWMNSVCGYACSDHAAWTQYGFPSASPSEAELFPYMHTIRDTIDNVNFEQVLEFSKLAVGYAVELAGPASL